MPTLSEDILREAISYADGWTWNWERAFSTAINDQSCALWGEGQLLPDQPKQWHLAALASQLISQILSAGFDFDMGVQGSHYEAPGMWIDIHDPVRSETHRFEYDARNPWAENSILVCTEFLREKENE